jgi:proteasome component ECM29
LIALREAKRNNAAYRPGALNALAEFADIRDDLNLLPDALAIVAPIIDELTIPSDDKMDIDSDSSIKSR